MNKSSLFILIFLLTGNLHCFQQGFKNPEEQLSWKLSKFGVVKAFHDDLQDNLLITVPNKAGKLSRTQVDHPLFRQAIEIVSYQTAENTYDITIQSPANTCIINVGDVIVGTFWVRCLNSENTGIGKIKSYIETSPTWSEVGSWEGEFDHQWKKLTLAGRIESPLNGNKLRLSIHCADREQTLQFGHLEMLLLSPYNKDFDIRILRSEISDPHYYAGMESEAPWRIEAAKRIDSFRKANLCIEVKNGSKRLKNSSLELQLTSHEFGFGTFLGGLENGENQSWTNQQFDKYLELSKSYFNRYTVPLYFTSWSTWGWPGKEFEKKYLFALNWAKHTGRDTRGHVTIWPSFHYMPFFVEYASNPVLIDSMIRKHVEYVMGHPQVKGYLRDWDIVNEVYANNDIIELFPNGIKVIADWYRNAKKTDPAANLFINDYGILNQDKKHQDAYYQLINALINEGAPIGGIGMQGHLHGAVAPETLLKTLDRFARLNIPIQITEFDFSSENSEADSLYMQDFLTAIFSHPAVDAITVWGFWKSAKLNWRPDFYFFDDCFTEQPIAAAWQRLIHQVWHTQIKQRSDAMGQLNYRGFKGTYGGFFNSGKDTFAVAYNLTDTTEKITVDTRQYYNIPEYPFNEDPSILVSISNPGYYQIGLTTLGTIPEKRWQTLNFRITVDEREAGMIYIEPASETLSGISKIPLFFDTGSHIIHIESCSLPEISLKNEAPKVQTCFLIETVFNDRIPEIKMDN